MVFFGEMGHLGTSLCGTKKLNKYIAAKKFHRPFHNFHWHGRTCISNCFKGPHVIILCLWIIEEHLNHGGSSPKGSDSLFFDEFKNPFGIKFFEDDDRASHVKVGKAIAKNSHMK